MVNLKRKALIGLAVVAWLGIGLFDAGCMNAHFRAEFHERYQDPSQSEFLGTEIVWAVSGPMTIPSQLVFNDYIYADSWTLTSKPFPCTEKSDFARQLWCGSNA